MVRKGTPFYELEDLIVNNNNFVKNVKKQEKNKSNTLQLTLRL